MTVPISLKLNVSDAKSQLCDANCQLIMWTAEHEMICFRVMASLVRTS